MSERRTPRKRIPNGRNDMAEDMEITEVSETEPQAASSLSQEERERIAQLPYEQARDELIQAVRALENGGLSLEDSMKQWELGEALAQRAQSLLGTIRAKLDAAQQAQAQTANTAGTQSNLES
ncbi:exonuclease VII small subunit [Bifidobacterium animalis subsp. animalis MCC 1489]|uniref:Exodeoxyribonuclease 7 small subunit n=3 Tax=Bifidobacterium animalis TaxID=28025 RepID=A0AB34T855_9BIFI|nr:exonuclease VII small subunit [Bifidobacterium animalis subsp. animalis MCC 0483]KOA58770.1 exonuclease VII small subunit [Bifidobacterium animalis subsp. animalis MCC 0499]KOA63563.1 exonuclease VII small subunit [Bifidobacterium animalis subsp. animalis MCC 1489]CDI68189.1 Exodeoxyribonuclease 7 small subunit (Exodeoxyribonuclease VII small subunit) [Bifidobacterium animalis subsp. animalis IM386]